MPHQFYPIPVPYAGQLTSATNRRGQPTQSAPAMLMDRCPGVDTVDLWYCAAYSESVAGLPEVPLTVERDGSEWMIRNGRCSLRVPAEIPADGHCPLWISAVRLDEGVWKDNGAVRLNRPLESVQTDFESRGEMGIQWSTTYHLVGGAVYRFRARWARGADTVEVEERCEAPDGGVLGFVDFHPAGHQAETRTHGGGEGVSSMKPLNRTGHYPSCSGKADECCHDYIGHISYWNQCTLSWIGFFDRADGFFVGLFSGWGDLWEQRDAQWLEVHQTATGIGFLRLPITPGRRAWGLVITDAEQACKSEQRCLLNRRKTQYADLAPVKIEHWELNTESSPSRLFSLEQVLACRKRLASHPDVLSRLQSADLRPEVRLLLDDDVKAEEAIFAELSQWVDREVQELCEGGYDRLIIFDGRVGKRVAHTWTLLQALGRVPDELQRSVPQTLLLLAYMMEDPAFCLSDDFYANEETLPKQLRRMGPAPVPPNFLAEYLTTVGVVALALSAHARSGVWQAHADDELRRFVERFFDKDGAYRESLNYHTHTLCSLLLYIAPLREVGGFDFLSLDRIRSSFSFLASLQMPPLYDQPALSEWRGHVFAQKEDRPVAPLPANGNSGSDGHEMMLRPDVSIAARMYRELDPALSGRLMTQWDRGGQLIYETSATLLTLLKLDPGLPRAEIPLDSFYSPSLGLVSRFSTPDGAWWSLIRAGDATHHMDFDQGHIHLVCDGEVILGDYGYHARDGEGNAFHAAATRRHSTVTTHPDPDYSQGYTGLEQAPRAHHVRITSEWDWLVHRMEINNYRDLSRLPYYVPVPAETPFTHIRQVLLLKKLGCLFVLDEFEGLTGDVTWRLYPRRPLKPEEPGVFRLQTERASGFRLHLLSDAPTEVLANQQEGALAEFAVRGSAIEGIAALLAADASGVERSRWDQSARRLSLRGPSLECDIDFPPAGAAADPVLHDESASP